MKLLLLSLLLLAGAGGYGLASRPDAAAAPRAQCDDSDCRVTVECTDHGTCLVTCYDANGDIRCQREVACDGPCEKACDRPCDKPCAPSKDRAR